jgi:hypothetical protein
MLKILGVIIAVFYAAAAYAEGPFGVVPGTKIEDLNIEREISPGRFLIEVPRGHSEFEAYFVVASDAQGVCLISGIGKEYDNDRFGVNVRKSFDRIRGQLERRYGGGRENFFLRDGAVWDSPNEWVMSIRQNERSHQLVWERGVNLAAEGSIMEILLTVNASSSDSSYLTLQYRFTNFEACRKELESAEEGSL